MRAVCVGDLMVDVIARLPGPIVIGSDRPAAISVHGGGAAANVACWLAWAGAETSFVGRVGDDAFGRHAVEELTAAGVRAVVEVDPVRPTGLCVVLVDEAGERSMLPGAGANDASVDPALLPAAGDLLYLSGYTLLKPGSRPFALSALEHARRSGWSIAVDAASAGPLSAFGPERFLDLIGTDLLLLANTDEARVLSGRAGTGDAADASDAAGTSDTSAVAVDLGRRCGQAVVKRGAAGALWSDGGDVVTAPATPLAPVDATGAGDAFAAGFLASTADEVRLRLEAGSATAARAVVAVGARPPAR